MPSPDESGRPPTQDSTNTHVDIDNIATAFDSDDDDDDDETKKTDGDRDQDTDSDVTCLSPACCSRFEALTGLDIRSIKLELEANRARSDARDHAQQPPASPLTDRCHGRSAFEGGPDHEQLHVLEKKAMALNRVDGPDELYVGGIFALRRPGAMEAKGITRILSMIKYSFVDWQGFEDRYVHLSVDVDDVDDEDILVHLPGAVRFIERGLNGGGTGEWPRGTVLPGSRSKLQAKEDGTTQGAQGDRKGRTLSEPEKRDLSLKDEAEADPIQPGAVFVHCAMGKSRSVTAVVAYLLWKYPHRYGLTPTNAARPDEETAGRAVQAAVDWVRRTREIAEPNPGFTRQLEMWVRMGRPADGDDAVERSPAYQRWLWEREVEESARIGKKPDWIIFEDETEAPREAAGGGGSEGAGAEPARELRCKKCRRVLATQRFIIPHHKAAAGKQACPHHFVEALSWMRPVLEAGELDGRLVCPNPRCGSSIGRYAWQGFKCSCDEWVCPAFSLGASKVDEVLARSHGPGAGGGPDARAALGIRMPPGKENL